MNMVMILVVFITLLIVALGTYSLILINKKTLKKEIDILFKYENAPLKNNKKYSLVKDDELGTLIEVLDPTALIPSRIINMLLSCGILLMILLTFSISLKPLATLPIILLTFLLFLKLPFARSYYIYEQGILYYNWTKAKIIPYCKIHFFEFSISKKPSNARGGWEHVRCLVLTVDDGITITPRLYKDGQRILSSLAKRFNIDTKYDGAIRSNQL